MNTEYFNGTSANVFHRWASSSATSTAAYVNTPSAPARLNASNDSNNTASLSSHPFCAAAFIIAYSPLT